ncbi:hypothetical protein FHR81_002161 [Actinoalloteichus hoggarensis]|uniref:Uncharacterized protein n=1 Tax=Actinoalloteichus hoggarensis TaxID=1470176 RepID=A0A221W685_9PSEU|nr:hypothetical protein [Actinoalloteichus hoggarensis]ASO21193.1 hypothetical protein AHOG_17840 [Actinoalloteichus hoggarensis]MBB5921123.1 hypothetical protein [Actinoalloteichus hoggarensis]
MGVADVVEQLRRAHARLTEALQATTEADAAIVAGATLFDSATVGSGQPVVEQAARHADAARDDVQAAHVLLDQVRELIDGYCRAIAGHGIDEAGVSAAAVSGLPASQAEPTPPPVPAGTTIDPEARYPGWIAELRRNGTPIDPERVLRMTRLRNGRIVWLRSRADTENSMPGFDTDRTDEFERTGVDADRVVDLVFRALDVGEPVSESGDAPPSEGDAVGDAALGMVANGDGVGASHRLVLEVDFERTRRRVAVTVAADGRISDARPLRARLGPSSTM